jgi:hypothetical protein
VLVLKKPWRTRKLEEFMALAAGRQQDVAPENGFWVSTYQRGAGGTDQPWIILVTEIRKSTQTGQRLWG